MRRDRRAITVTSERFDIRLPLGDGPPVITDGLGGWELIARPRGKAITQWTGSNPIAMDVPIALDRWAAGGSVERDFRRLLRLGRTEEGEEEPPRFRVDGPIPYSGTQFVLNGTPSFDELLRREPDGAHQRVVATLPLLEHVRGDRLRVNRKPRYRKTIKAKKGDSIRKIAVRIFGDASKAREIGKLNGIRDIRRELKPGKVIRLRGKRDGKKKR